jgi:hypothetical protein
MTTGLVVVASNVQIRTLIVVVTSDCQIVTIGIVVTSCTKAVAVCVAMAPSHNVATVFIKCNGVDVDVDDIDDVD